MLYQPTLVKIKSTMKSVLKVENNKLNGNLFFYYAMIINIFDYKLKIGNISFLKICNSFQPLFLGFPTRSWKKWGRGGSLPSSGESKIFVQRILKGKHNFL